MKQIKPEVIQSIKNMTVSELLNALQNMNDNIQHVDKNDILKDNNYRELIQKELSMRGELIG